MNNHLDIIYNIKFAECAYNPDNVVLEIEDLQIPRGGLYFVLGSSGLGKSTLIETLGLMSNTFKKNTDEIIYKTGEGQEVNIKNLWHESDHKLSNFRKKEFSFVFQNTNLMPHFTAGENMMYTLLFEGKSINEAKEKVLNLMTLLSLPEDVFDRQIHNLSGGQRQRCAFVRAFVSEFNVLFGDEPTGNLDANTGAAMMQILKDYIKSQNKTAIIVSHDIQLSIAFADGIFCLSKKINSSGNIKGCLNSESFFHKQGDEWYKNGKKIPNLAGQLKQYL